MFCAHVNQYQIIVYYLFLFYYNIQLFRWFVISKVFSDH